MQCPVDNTTLVMSERQGIEIDYCPQCRGVWLDRGEIDKIIERSVAEESPRATDTRNDQRDSRPPQFEERREHHSERRDYDDDNDHHGGYNQGSHHKKRKESFFSDLFD